MKQSNVVAPEHCGARLKQARQAAGLTLEDVSARLKMPLRIVRSLESDDWSELGAPVFARGQLRSYARLLGVDIEPELTRSEIAVVIPPELVSHSHTPRYQRVFEQAMRRAIYIVLTAAIAVPVWLATRPHLSNDLTVESLELPTLDGPAQVAPVSSRKSPPQRTPLIASMTSMTTATAPELSLSFTGDSWVQVFASDGRSIEQGLLAAGEHRTYSAGEVGRVVLGNSAVVDVKHAGKSVDLAPFSRANVARFTLSSDGSLAPVVD
jgi:cytoskeleton protein RodZ